MYDGIESKWTAVETTKTANQYLYDFPFGMFAEFDSLSNFPVNPTFQSFQKIRRPCRECDKLNVYDMHSMFSNFVNESSLTITEIVVREVLKAGSLR